MTSPMGKATFCWLLLVASLLSLSSVSVSASPRESKIVNNVRNRDGVRGARRVGESSRVAVDAVAAASEDLDEAEVYLYYNGDEDVKSNVKSMSVVAEYRGPSLSNFEFSNHPRVVVFYSPYCPACQEFKSTFVKLAKKTRALHPVVEFYAVSCVAHNEMCLKYSVPSYPSVYAFRQNERGSGHLMEESDTYTVHSIETALRLNHLAGDSAADLEKQKQKRRHTRKLNEGGVDGQNEQEDDQDQEEEDAQGDADRTSVNEEDEDEEEQETIAEDTDSNGEKSGDLPAKNEVWEHEEEAAVEGNEAEGEKEDDDGENDDDDVENDGENEDEDQENEAGNEDEEADAEKEDVEEQPDEENFDNAFGDNVYTNDRMPPPGLLPDRTQYRKPGAETAKEAGSGEINKWKQELRERRAKTKQMASSKNLFKRLAKKGPHNDAKPTSGATASGGATSVGATDRMKANRPGTLEFAKRTEELKQKLEAIRKKRRHRETDGHKKRDPPQQQPHRRYPHADEGASAGAFSPPRGLPYKKVITAPRVVEKLPVVKRMVSMSDEEALILDSSMAFVKGLKFGLFKQSGPLNAKQKKSLKDWFDLLSVSLPPEWGLHEVIDALNNNIDYISQEYDNMQAVLSKHRLPRNEWSKSCESTKAGGKFPCGFWKLLHVMTVGMAEHRGGLNLIAGEIVGPDTRTFSPSEAADVVREYMAYFFPCKHCAQHFVAQYDECVNNRRCDRLANSEDDATDEDWKELAKWMWEVHNDVSVRVLHEQAKKLSEVQEQSGSLLSRIEGRGQVAAVKADTKDIIQALWPNIEMCFKCLKEDGTWDEDEVFLYLERVYWPGAELDPKADRLLKLYGEPVASPMRQLFIYALALAVLFYTARGKWTLSKSGYHRSLILAKSLVRQQKKRDV